MDVKIRKGLNGHPASFRDIMYEDVKSIGSIILGCIIGGEKYLEETYRDIT
jgi:hypothetical protein